MGSKACIDFTKYFLFLFNLFFFILGATLLSLGLWILFDETTFISIIFSPPVSLSFFSYILAGGGVFTMAIGFFGCLGALKEVRCMLGMYFFLLVLLLASQIIGGILLYTQWKTVESRMQKAVKQLIAGFGDENSEMKHFEPTLEFVQRQMQCCGWDSFQDWHQKQHFACSCIRGSQTVTNNKTEQGDGPDKTEQGDGPDKTEQGDVYGNNSSVLDVLDFLGDNMTESGDVYNVTEQLYGDNSSETYSTTSTPVNPSSSSPPRQVCHGQPYEQGCKLGITNWLKQNLTLILGVCAAVVAVELFGMILSMYLYRQFKLDYDKLTRFS
ncbi:CD82 antigen-like [Lepisosteus oculatus]|uniref:CD82 antigen-like n=1 Tax=Lepisosteus oculatus TaxID=7918 RepID=UPI003712FDDA